jgi:hypothetical protein
MVIIDDIYSQSSETQFRFSRLKHRPSQRVTVYHLLNKLTPLCQDRIMTDGPNILWVMEETDSVKKLLEGKVCKVCLHKATGLRFKALKAYLNKMKST